MQGNLNVAGFFLIGTLAFAAVAWRFFKTGVNPHKEFGAGLGLLSLAFLMFGGIVATQPAALDLWMTVAVIPLIAGFFFLVRSATFDWTSKNRAMIQVVAGVFFAVLYVARTFAFPSEPGFSKAGLIYFNAQPPVLLLYLLAFVGAFMTALQVNTLHIGNRLQAALTRIFFNVVVVCSVVLLSANNDETLQTYNGWVLVAAFVALLAVYLPGSAQAKLAK